MSKHTWKYANIGGNTRVVIKDGKDIQHLAELDEKLWAVLACPVSGLELPEESLRCIDMDKDNKIHVKEVVETAQWLCSVLHKPDVLLAGTPSLQLTDIKDESLQDIATPLAVDGVITLEAVKAAIGAVVVEQQPLPEAPYTAEVTAAYKACKEAYSQYYTTARLQALGLATLPTDAVVPGLTEEAFAEMGKKIADYEAGKAAAEAANASALAAAQAQYRPLEKLLLLCRDFCTLLRNFVSFQDFYAKRGKALLGRGADDESPWAIFQAGTLVIDQRACNLCMKVSDMAKHNTQAADSGMFLIYCNCKHHATGQTMQIVAAMTVGDIRHLKVGKNALFYDRQGRDWEAEVVKIIDNPISIGQAFWSPYRKLGEWVSGLITKSAAEKEKKSFADMTAKLQTTPAAPAAAQQPAQPAPFDIAKFAGIFAAIGMAVGYIGSFFTSIALGLKDLGWWGWLVIPGLLLVISGPSMILAWMKLRKRNLAPLLNANGWAINADAIVNVLFGNTLTEQAQYPIMKLKDPFAKKGLSKGSKWSIAIAAIVLGIAIAVVTLYLCGFRVCVG
ncbi:MAG: phage holin family protein [Paludibacteraceae bacterium]|nr:phage holin family protein [Paludibacteraceae bacterium]MBO5013744.1 phage holin family protein [Paludibacteraceae bacterium]MBP3576455.1 phage holin family protein [Paludibacteraceae bacterium]